MSKKDPTDAIRKKASNYPGVDEGTACTQSSFKAGKKSFLFIGEQGGRYKAMFKLKDGQVEATKLEEAAPDDFQVGTNGWVTARFSAEKPLPRALWTRWLDESYALSAPKKKTSNAKVSTRKAKPGTRKKRSK